jgi:hypothetical protein
MAEITGTQATFPVSARLAVAETDRMLMMLFTLILVGLAVTIGLTVALTPLETLLDRYIPDDAFYYLQTARVFAQTGFSSFDGLHFTNGYHPLWFLIQTPIFWLFPEGGETPLRLILLAQVVMAGVTAAILFRTLARLFGMIESAVAVGVYIALFTRISVNGLETALLMCLYALTLAKFAHLRLGRAPARPSDHVLLGVLVGLTFLARTDMVFLAGLIFLSYFVRRDLLSGGFKPALLEALRYALPVALLAGSYLLINLVTTGHLTQVSGAAKAYYSYASREAAIAAGGDRLAVYVQNVIWAFRNDIRHIGLASVMLLALTLAGLHWRVLRMLPPLFPFVAAGVLAYLYYGVFFYGFFSQTGWYFGPQALLAALTVAALATALRELRIKTVRFSTLGVVFAAILAGWILRLLSHEAALLAFAAAPLVGAASSLRPRVGKLIRQSAPVIGLGALALLVGGNLLTLARDSATPLTGWGAHLLYGARWARENLPPEMTIWAGSSGILGYFSNRTVVNVDGLINDYDFLENYLIPGRHREYYVQYDFGVDTFPLDRPGALEREGCLLPAEMFDPPPPFNDAGTPRQLGFYQMQQQGMVDCAVVEGE